MCNIGNCMAHHQNNIMKHVLPSLGGNMSPIHTCCMYSSTISQHSAVSMSVQIIHMDAYTGKGAIITIYSKTKRYIELHIEVRCNIDDCTKRNIMKKQLTNKQIRHSGVSIFRPQSKKSQSIMLP